MRNNFLYDCHCHLNLPQFNDNRDDVISRLDNELAFVINVGFDLKSSEASIALNARYPFIWAAIGIHPADTVGVTENDLIRIKNMAHEPSVVAIGEIGLDYYWMKDTPTNQKLLFRKQMTIAADLGKPVIIHDRDAHDDVLSVMNEFNGSVKGVLHSFSGDTAMMHTAHAMGYYFSISGPVTYPGKRSEALRDAVKAMPADRILIETDSPYLAPQPMRGKSNEPVFVRHVFDFIVNLREEEPQHFSEQVRNNARAIFGI